jgi:hypothetical protein
MSEREKINCYISHNFDLEDRNFIQKFINCFDDNFKFLTTTENKEDSYVSINKSDISIAIVTLDYLTSKSLINEFEFIIEGEKPILIVFDPTVTEIYENDDNIELQEILQYIKLMRAFKNYKLKKGPRDEGFDFDEECKDIKIILNEIKNQEREQLNLNKNMSLISAIDITNIKEFSKKNTNQGTYIIRATTCGNEQRIVLITYNKNKNAYFLSIYDKNVSFLTEYQTTDLNIEIPNLISTNTNKEILIVDNKDGALHIFDYDFNFLSTNNFELKDYNDMAVDQATNDIYLIKCFGESNIKKVDYTSKSIELINWEKPDEFKPKFIKITKNVIIILNVHSIRINETSNEWENDFGVSFLYLLNKITFRILEKIDFMKDHLIQPWALIVDKDSNIYTTAYQLNEFKYVSNMRFLIKLNKDGNIIDRSSLENDCIPKDMIYSNGKLILLEEDLFYIYEKK